MNIVKKLKAVVEHWHTLERIGPMKDQWNAMKARAASLTTELEHANQRIHALEKAQECAEPVKKKKATRKKKK